MGGAKYSIFHKGSQTYSTASFFFPPRVGDDIASLYSFVRVADDYVDNVPQDLAGYTAFKNDYFARRSKMPIVLDFKRIERIYHFDPEWASAFFRSMDMDLSRTSYDYEGGFAVDLMAKDLGLAIEAAERSNSATPLGHLSQKLYQDLSKAGSGRLDFSSILRFLQNKS
jgi:phytoene/squalene synthetase